MIWKQYAYAALVGAGIAFGDIISSRINGSGLGATHVIVSCVLTALMIVKITKVAESRR
jgi:uncharacterized membrane-anchored protein